MEYKDKIEIFLESYQQEIRIACQAYYAYKSLNTIPYNDKKIRARLNRTPVSWLIIMHSLQATFIMSLGRLFDENGDAQSIHSIIKYCENPKNRREFSKGRLYRRKIRDGFSDPLARDYIRTKQYPSGKFFSDLNLLKKKYAKDSKNYKKIRHRVFGHRIAKTTPEAQRLFLATSVDEIEEILEFLYKVGRIIRSLVNNGDITELHNHGFLEKGIIEDDIEKLLNDFA